MLFHPVLGGDEWSDVPEIAGVKGKDVYFQTHDSCKLNGWYYKLPGAKYTILFSHGNAGNLYTRLPSIQALLNAGASVFVYDYRGFGKSEGHKPDIRGICDDGCAAHDYLVEKEAVDPDTIVLYGESLGVGVTTQVSTMRHARGMILQSGFASLPRISREHMPVLWMYPRLLFPDPPLDSLAILKRPHPPLLLVHGVLDTVVPIAHADDLFRHAAEPKQYIRLTTCGHGDIATTNPEEYSSALRQFLGSL